MKRPQRETANGSASARLAPLAQIGEKEAIMSDDLKNRGQQDRNRINVNEEWEVRHWTEALGVSREELERAVQQVGPSVDAVRQHLGRR
jgi:hypothetical protein